MSAIKKIFCLALVSVAATAAMGCKAPVRTPEAREMRIRYLNLPALVDYLASGDEAARSLRERRTGLRQTMAGLEEKLVKGGPDPEAVIRGDLKKYGAEMKELDRSEEKIKRKYYESINKAAGAVARRMHLDYVLNIGDDLVYARRENDITELVLQELSNLKNRNEPHSK